MSKRNSTAVMARRLSPPRAIDYFPTPPWATFALCEWLTAHSSDGIRNLSCLEPAGGGGHMVMVLEHYFRRVTAVDLYDPADKGYPRLDFLTATPLHYSMLPDPYKFDWIITNPPFSQAAAFAQMADRRSYKGFALLCRTAFLETQGRYRDLFAVIPPSAVLVFSERVAMVEGRYDPKASSATSYSWFVWDKVAISRRFPDQHIPPALH